MSDAQTVVDALVAAEDVLVRAGYDEPEEGNETRGAVALATIRAAIPIARAQAEREREKDALIADLVQSAWHKNDCWYGYGPSCTCGFMALLDRARAAGVEVQQ